MGRLQGKVAIVTGASRGIGAGIARMFAAEGACVVLAARTVERLDAVARDIADSGGEACVVPTDVSKTDDLRHMVEVAAERYGALHVVVNNAAIASFSRHLDADDLEVEYARLMDTNVKSVIMSTHFALPHLKVSGGSIINISSVHGLASGSRMSAYAASKGALIAGTRAMAVELAPWRIRVNCISPGTIWHDAPGGWIRRRLGDALADEYAERFGDWAERVRTLQQPLPVAGAAEDVAFCAVYLASDESRFCTGANVVLDGGMTAVLADPAYLHPGVAEASTTGAAVRAWVAEARRRAEGEPSQA